VDGTGDHHLVEFTRPDAGQCALHALHVGVRPAVADLGRATHRLPERQRARLQIRPAAADARVANVAITLAPVHEFGEAQLTVWKALPYATGTHAGRERKAPTRWPTRGPAPCQVIDPNTSCAAASACPKRSAPWTEMRAAQPMPTQNRSAAGCSQ